jgi:hypothetical protein
MIIEQRENNISLSEFSSEELSYDSEESQEEDGLRKAQGPSTADKE